MSSGNIELILEASGPPGPAGATGATGAQGPPGVGANWRGVWSSSTTYAIGDGVYRNGSPYISNTASNLNHDPATDTGTNWSPLGGVSVNGSTGQISILSQPWP